jgi:hypothetical protein
VSAAKIYPSDPNVWLLVSDAIRLEANGKLTLLGFFGGPNVNLLPEASLPASINITLLFLLNDGEGTFNSTLSIKNPSGTPVTVHQQTLIKPRDVHGIIVGLQPFIVPELGAYELVLNLDDRRYVRHIHIGKPPAKN